MSQYIKDLAKAMRWAKWPFLILAIIVTIVLLSVKPESDTRLGTIFGYYFQSIFAFAVLSGGIGSFYGFLLLENLVSDYTDECAQMFGFKSPIHAYRFFKFAAEVGDEQVRRWAKKGIFWLFCTCSILVTAPLGMIVFISLIRRGA